MKQSEGEQEHQIGKQFEDSVLECDNHIQLQSIGVSSIQTKQQYSSRSSSEKPNFDIKSEVISCFPDSIQSGSRVSELSKGKHGSHVDRTNKLRIKSPQKSIKLNIIVVGQTGLGKSTFIDSILDQKQFKRSQNFIKASTQKITECEGIINYQNQSFHLTFIDTQGYQFTKQKQWFQDIKSYISRKYIAYQDQQKYIYLNRDTFTKYNDFLIDDRVHVCIYFLSGPRPTSVDLTYMKKLSKLVNVIPVLAKGDQYTRQEVIEIKTNYQSCFEFNKFDLYDCFKACDEKMKTELLQSKFGACPPFMITTSSNKFITSEGQIIQGRQYPWGVCNQWNSDHSDLKLFYKLLIGYYSIELIALTDYYQHKYIQHHIEKKKQKKSMNFFKLIVNNINQILSL